MIVRKNFIWLKFIVIYTLLCNATLVNGQTSIPSLGSKGVMGNLDVSFQSPPNAFRMIQYSRHEGGLMPIAKLQEYGVGGVLLFQSKNNYLRSDESWANLKTNIDLAKKAGMQVWIGDDNGFPSGQAGGLLVATNPAFEARCLRLVSQKGNGPEVVQMILPSNAERFLTAFIYPEKNGSPVYHKGEKLKVFDKNIKATGLKGNWTIEAFALEINNDSGSPAMLTKGGFNTTGHYPNLLDSSAMKKFVNLTHDEYVRRLGSLKGKVDVFYSNEPRSSSTWEAAGSRTSGEILLPWVNEMPKRFQKDHGYDLLPYLPALFSGSSEVEKVTRRHFYQTLGNIFAQNYTGRLRRWAEKNGVLTSGHLNHEERMDSHVIQYGDFFQVLREQSIPGIDFPMPDTGKAYFEYFPDHIWDFWFPKQISSIAQLNGQKTVSCLIDPIVNRKKPTLQPSIDMTMRSVNMLFLAGVNQLSSYVNWYDYQPNDYRQLNEYIGRLAVILRGASNSSNIAMYYPIETFQSQYLPSPKQPYGAELENPESLNGQRAQEKIIRNLYQNGFDFNWLDHKAILASKIIGNRIVIGKNEYSTIIMPHINLLPLAIIKKLKQFEKAGGIVLWVDVVPSLGDQANDHKLVRSAVASSRPISAEEVVKYLGAPFPNRHKLRLNRVGQGIFNARFERNGKNVNYVINDSDSQITTNLHLEGKSEGKVWVYDPTDGSIIQQDISRSLTIKPYKSVLIIE